MSNKSKQSNLLCLYFTTRIQPQLLTPKRGSKLKMLLLVLLSFCLFSLPAQAINVYVLSSGDINIDNHIKTTLEGFGHNVRIGVQYNQLTGSSPLAGYDSVLFLHSANCNSLDVMPSTGQTALQNFISYGGGLVTGEWIVYHTISGGWPTRFGILSSALPANPSSQGSSYNRKSPITYAAVEPNSVLNSNVDSPFTFQADQIVLGTETQFVPKAGALVFYDSDNLGVGVVGWDYGDGRVISFSTVIGISELSNRNYRQLLSNALIWSAHQKHGPICTKPIPGDINNDCKVDFADFAIMMSHWLECNLEPQSECWN